MKKIYYVMISIAVLLNCNRIFAQLPQLIGTTLSGGSHDRGIFYKINLDGSGFTPVYSLEGYGFPTNAKMILAGKKLLYGLAIPRGMTGGQVFSFDPVNNIYTKVHEFTYEEGFYPDGGLVLANNNLLYGTTYNSTGVIFSYDPVSDTFITISKFQNSSLGYSPHCTMIQATDGKLYGTTSQGGLYNDGVIFSFNISNNTYTKEYDFNKSINPLLSYPSGGLVQVSGLIYGFSGFLDLHGKALIYSFNPSTKVFSIVHQFPENYFKNPNGPPTLTVDFFGTKLYGVASGCCSPQQNQKIFYINTLDKTYHESFTFNGSDGDGPAGGLLNYNVNHFYGITKAGGSGNNGVIFQYDASKFGGFSKQHDFTGGAGGATPISNLTYVSCTAKPAKPKSISGSTSATCNKTKKYSTNRVPGATSYTWKIPAGATIQGTSNDTAITILWGTQSGNVSVQAINDCGKSAKRTITVSVSCSQIASATKSTEFVSAASVSPNPTTGNITVKFYSNISSKYRISLKDITGRILLVQEINATTGENIVKLDLGKIAKGIYYIELSGNNDRKIFKIQVQ